MGTDRLAPGRPPFVERFERNQGIAEQPLGDLDIADGLVEQETVSLLHRVEVRAQAVLLVLLLESFQVAEAAVDADKNLDQPSLERRPPALLSAHDLVAAVPAGHRLYVANGLVSPG